MSYYYYAFLLAIPKCLLGCKEGFYYTSSNYERFLPTGNVRLICRYLLTSALCPTHHLCTIASIKISLEEYICSSYNIVDCA